MAGRVPGVGVDYGRPRGVFTLPPIPPPRPGSGPRPRILPGGAVGAVAGIRTEADRLGLSADQRGAADRARRCLEYNAAYLHYDKAPEAGRPIASGIVEGPARRLVADRLDITGSRWTVPGSGAVLTLRALIGKGDFPQCWAFHTHRERERLYPRPDRHDCELLA
ncbi:hypothetical protein E4K10_46380 [Streptomyces sp. T1317-0309]|nr:hypothetical protein E4K10_46380 [Streptomyces sp. T1317-0309]